ncbi:acyl-CoA thioesterase [Ascidiimonas sp. W6]|uniref:acyl-CoA thioesterase n=1 Tax=Ascidiimonas meishanensis TaxID=3128903 RepID=UPI0030EF3E6B
MNYFKTSFTIKWSDVDPYMHLRNSVYLDFGDQTRIAYFREHGYPFHKFITSGYGPVILRSSCEYMREVLLDETITLDCQCFFLSRDFSRWGIQHNVRKQDQTLACILRVEGGFLDLSKRKLIQPEERIQEIIRNIPTTKDFKVEIL